ncbi:MAG: TOBE domain-containing protein [Methanobrevibacter sp.]|jgi:molybdate transport system regulatory protein|nr:TOBE domain-containing protein [Candidatus Methanovirga meridionalis]
MKSYYYGVVNISEPQKEENKIEPQKEENKIEPQLKENKIEINGLSGSITDIKVVPAYDLCWKGKRYLLSAKKFNLINAINIYSSISKSTKALGVSYRTTFNYINDIQDNLDIKLFIGHRGGLGGGGSANLTSDGKKILKACVAVNTIIELHKGFNEIETVVSNFDKNNNMMEIKIDEDYNIKLPLKEEYSVGDKVLALISYEDIFITLKSCQSSVRNILKGNISEMKLINHMLRIKVNVGNVGFYSDITKLSSDELNLQLGKEVYVCFKAMGIALLKL